MFTKKYFKKSVKKLMELKSILQTKLKRFVVMKDYRWKRSLVLFFKDCNNF